MKRAAYPHAKPYHDHRRARRWRYRRKGFSREIGRAFGSDEFKARYEAAEAEFLGKKAEGAGADRTRPGSFGDLVQRWYRSAEFKALEASTQANYRRQVEPVRMRFASDPLAELRRKHIAALLAEKSETPSAANNLRKRLCQILDYGVSLDMIAQNPARQVKPYRTKGEGFKTWDEGQIARYLDVHGPGTIARVALLLMLHTGAARVDAVALGPWNIKAGRFEYRRSKTEKTGGDLISIPLHRDLAAELDSLPKDRPYLATQYGKPRTPEGLGNAMRKWCNRAGLDDVAAHGLRKACARRLADAGATAHEIASITGHKTLAEVQRYTAAANRKTLADSAAEKLDIAQAGGQNLVNHADRFTKKQSNPLKEKG